MGAALQATGSSSKDDVETDVDELIDPLPGKLRKTVVSSYESGRFLLVCLNNCTECCNCVGYVLYVMVVRDCVHAHVCVRACVQLRACVRACYSR